MLISRKYKSMEQQTVRSTESLQWFNGWYRGFCQKTKGRRRKGKANTRTAERTDKTATAKTWGRKIDNTNDTGLWVQRENTEAVNGKSNKKQISLNCKYWSLMALSQIEYNSGNNLKRNWLVQAICSHNKVFVLEEAAIKPAKDWDH